MNNFDLLMDYKFPIHVSDINFVTPNITLDSIYANVISFYEIVRNIIIITWYTVQFIIIQGSIEFINITKNMNIDKLIVVISVYTIFMMGLIHASIKKINKQTEQIKELEDNLETQCTLGMYLERKIDITQKQLNNLSNKTDEKLNEVKYDIILLETRLNLIEKKNKILETRVSVVEKKNKILEKEIKIYQ